MKYRTVEEIRKAFIKQGWKNPTFEKVEEVDVFGRRMTLYKMDTTGNLFDDTGKIYRYNIKPITTN